MAIKARLQPFLENFLELRLKREDVPDARCARSHPFGLLFFEFKKVEVVTAIFLFLGASESFLRNGEKRETGRKRERFLRAGEHHVYAERVHVDLHRGE